MKDKFILNTNDYTYAPYSNKGFSGQLYLAMPKNGGKRLIIKHENPCSAGNEFMYSRLAGLLGIPTPTTYLMNVAKEDAHLFASPYVVGIEYIDGLRSFTSDELNDPKYAVMPGSNFANVKYDYAGHYSLSIMFDQSDAIQLSMTPDEHIVGFDFSDSFCFTKAMMDAFKVSRKVGLQLLQNGLQAFREKSFDRAVKCAAPIIAKHINYSDKDAVGILHTPMKRFELIDQKDIDKLLNAVGEVYPEEIVSFYTEYIAELRRKIDEYIPIAENYRSPEEVRAALSDDYEANYNQRLEAARAEFGSRAVKELIAEADDVLKSYRAPGFALDDLEETIYAIMDAFIIAKRKNAEKYTPKKYRKDAADEV